MLEIQPLIETELLNGAGGVVGEGRGRGAGRREADSGPRLLQHSPLKRRSGLGLSSAARSDGSPARGTGE